MTLKRIEIINIITNDKITYKSDVIPKSGDMISIASDMYRVLEVIHKITGEQSTSLLAHPIDVKNTIYIN